MDAEYARRRRAIIREFHPDRGGDAALMNAKLAELARAQRGVGPVVIVSTSRSRRIRYALRRVARKTQRRRYFEI